GLKHKAPPLDSVGAGDRELFRRGDQVVDGPRLVGVVDARRAKVFVVVKERRDLKVAGNSRPRSRGGILSGMEEKVIAGVEVSLDVRSQVLGKPGAVPADRPARLTVPNV